MYINGPDGLDQQVVRMHGLGGVHPPDPLHLVAGVQRFRNALSICHLLYQPKKKLLCLSVNRKSAVSESLPRRRFSVVDQSEHFTAKPPLKK